MIFQTRFYKVFFCLYDNPMEKPPEQVIEIKAYTADDAITQAHLLIKKLERMKLAYGSEIVRVEPMVE